MRLSQNTRVGLIAAAAAVLAGCAQVPDVHIPGFWDGEEETYAADPAGAPEEIADRLRAAQAGAGYGQGQPGYGDDVANSTQSAAYPPQPSPAGYVAATQAPTAYSAKAAGMAMAKPAPGPDAFADIDPASARSVLYALHLASYRSDDHAQQGWRLLQADAGATLAGLTPRIEVADLGSKGVYRRLKAGPFNTKAEAASRCEALRAAGHYCQLTDFAGRAL